MPAVALVLLAIASCGSSEGVVAEDAWSTPVPPVSPSRAIYFDLSNGLDTPITLTGGSSPACGGIEVHETRIDASGVMQMRPLGQGLRLGPGESFQLGPGGIHLMCLQPAVFEGSFEVTLQLAGAEPVPIVVAIADR